MKKTVALLLALLSVALILSACGSSIVGTWEYSNGILSYDFKKDGTVYVTLSSFLSYKGTYEVKGSKITLSVSVLGTTTNYEYTYKVKGDVLTLTGDTSMSGVTQTVELTRKK